MVAYVYVTFVEWQFEHTIGVFGCDIITPL